MISFRFGRLVLVVSFDGFVSLFWLVHAVTFQTSHVGKDKLYGVGWGKHVLLAREGRLKSKNYRHFYVSVVLVVSFRLFRWFRWFRSGVPGFSTCLSQVLREDLRKWDLWVGYHVILLR